WHYDRRRRACPTPSTRNASCSASAPGSRATVRIPTWSSPPHAPGAQPRGLPLRAAPRGREGARARGPRARGPPAPAHRRRDDLGRDGGGAADREAAPARALPRLARPRPERPAPRLAPRAGGGLRRERDPGRDGERGGPPAPAEPLLR